MLKFAETANRPGLCSLRLLDWWRAEGTETPGVRIPFNPCELTSVLRTKPSRTEKKSASADDRDLRTTWLASGEIRS